MFRKKKKAEEISLKQLFDNADWPKTYSITMQLANGATATALNISASTLATITGLVESGSGTITLHGEGGNTVIPAHSVVYFTETAKEPTMWNEDKL